MKLRPLVATAMAFSLVGGMLFTPTARAADHRDSNVVDAVAEGDMPDAYAFINPNRPDYVVLALNVNPFINPNQGGSYRLDTNYLYQLKVDSNGDAIEDAVVQIRFFDIPGGQRYEMRLGQPNNPGNEGPREAVRDTLISAPIGCQGIVYSGDVNADNPALNNGRNGREPVEGLAGSRCFVGPRDDPFVTDVGQAVFRIGLNPNPTRNLARHEQDVFRNTTVGTGLPLGPLRGRPLRADGTSGVDGFGGYNATHIAVEFPKNLIRGSGNPARGPVVTSIDGSVSSRSIPACGSCINVWGTVSEREGTSSTFKQFERMGQQLFNTVWAFAQPPTNSTTNFPGVSDSGLKDLVNTLSPQYDESNFSYLIPDSLVINVAPTAENNILVRRAALAAFTAPGNGVAYSLDTAAFPFNILRAQNTDRRLHQRLILPDVLRLDIDRVSPSPALPGAQTLGNSDPVLGYLQFGLQNGRRPADDVTDIVLRFARELTDVTLTAAGEADPDRRALRGLFSVQFPPVDGNSLLSDARVGAVLQGTDFIEPLQVDLENLANSGNDRGLNTTFPFFSEQHPQPNEFGATTTGFPVQNDTGLPVLTGTANSLPDTP